MKILLRLIMPETIMKDSLFTVAEELKNSCYAVE
jgi:hypothetical protein